MRSRSLEEIFPYLKKSGYEVKSEEDTTYNCIAWAANIKEKMISWWPRRGYYWPRTPKKNESIEEFIEVFESMGYEICDSHELEEGFEKVAIFIDSGDYPQHIARQLPSGLWTSKCGDFEDIEHKLEGLQGEQYGKVKAVLKRKKRL